MDPSGRVGKNYQKVNSLSGSGNSLDEPVSVPIDAGQNPAATATPLPAEEVPGEA
jgi:hypothetical protein